jgi:peptidoglycan-associated lipoprotein
VGLTGGILLLHLALSTPDAAAQPASRETLIGTFSTQPGPALAEVRSSRPGGPHKSAAAETGRRASPEDAAEELYRDAADDLAAGLHAAGQRLLEILIARHPDTLAADRARRDLARLYAALPVPATEPPGRSSLGAAAVIPPLPSPAPSPSVRPAAIANSPTEQSWRTEVRHARSLQDELRHVAGDRIFFSEGSAELGLSARGVLAEQARWLARHFGLRVVIEGHADDPSVPHLQAGLAERRADAVRARLIENGVAPERIGVVGHADREPAAVCSEALCAAQNRRAVTLVQGGAGAAGRALAGGEPNEKIPGGAGRLR